MKCLNNRAETHLRGQVECELDAVGRGAWVNQGYCGSPPPLPRAVSTIYNPQPLFQGSMDSMYKLDSPGLFDHPPVEQTPAEKSQEKKQRGCCSFIKGEIDTRYFTWKTFSHTLIVCFYSCLLFPVSADVHHYFVVRALGHDTDGKHLQQQGTVCTNYAEGVTGLRGVPGGHMSL